MSIRYLWLVYLVIILFLCIDAAFLVEYWSSTSSQSSSESNAYIPRIYSAPNLAARPQPNIADILEHYGEQSEKWIVPTPKFTLQNYVDERKNLNLWVEQIDSLKQIPSAFQPFQKRGIVTSCRKDAMLYCILQIRMLYEVLQVSIPTGVNVHFD